MWVGWKRLVQTSGLEVKVSTILIARFFAIKNSRLDIGSAGGKYKAKIKSRNER